MFKQFFENAGKSLQALAVIFFWVFIGLAGVMVIGALIYADGAALYLLRALRFLAIGIVSGLLLRAFGDLVVDIRALREKLAGPVPMKEPPQPSPANMPPTPSPFSDEPTESKPEGEE